MSVRSASALLELARWPNVVIAAGGVLLGAWWARWGRAPAIAATVGAAVALTIVANAWNDAADVDIDRVAHPARPIPRGLIQPRAARVLAMGAAAIAIMLAALVAWGLALLTALVVMLMLAYSPWLKRLGIVGNLVTAALASLPFLYGGWAAGEPRATLRLVAIAIPLHLAREVAKDLEDAPADVGYRRTLPLLLGPGGARLAFVAAVIVFVLLLAPVAGARPAFAVAILPALTLIAIAGWHLTRGRRGAPAVLKLAMLCAMAAFLLARP